MSDIGKITEQLLHVKERVDLYTSQTFMVAKTAKNMSSRFEELLRGSNTGSLQFIQGHLQESYKNLMDSVALLKLSADALDEWIAKNGGTSGTAGSGNAHPAGPGSGAGMAGSYNIGSDDPASAGIPGSVSGGSGIASAAYSAMTSDLKAANVDYHAVQAAGQTRTREEIIRRLGGGDQTYGSCSSLALAYAGNTAGYDVLDFRGGESRKYFASRKTVEKIAGLSGVDSTIFDGRNDTNVAHKLLNCMIPGKEYYFAVGKHAAIIRNNGDRTEYLELQHPFWNGWYELNDEELTERFGCSLHLFYNQTGFLIEVDSLSKNNEFLSLLGYINTDENVQMKGIDGYVR